jgi:hypothetical protein
MKNLVNIFNKNQKKQFFFYSTHLVSKFIQGVIFYKKNKKKRTLINVINEKSKKNNFSLFSLSYVQVYRVYI